MQCLMLTCVSLPSSGITSFIFTKYGQGYYLLTSSEYQKVTLSARYQGDIKCTIELPEGMRPEAPQEPEPQAAGGETAGGGEPAPAAAGGEQPASEG